MLTTKQLRGTKEEGAAKVDQGTKTGSNSLGFCRQRLQRSSSNSNNGSRNCLGAVVGMAWEVAAGMAAANSNPCTTVKPAHPEHHNQQHSRNTATSTSGTLQLAHPEYSVAAGAIGQGGLRGSQRCFPLMHPSSDLPLPHCIHSRAGRQAGSRACAVHTAIPAVSALLLAVHDHLPSPIADHPSLPLPCNAG